MIAELFLFDFYCFWDLSADRAKKQTLYILTHAYLLTVFFKSVVHMIKIMGLYWYLSFQVHIREFILALLLFLFITFFSNSRNTALIIYSAYISFCSLLYTQNNFIFLPLSPGERLTLARLQNFCTVLFCLWFYSLLSRFCSAQLLRFFSGLSVVILLICNTVRFFYYCLYFILDPQPHLTPYTFVPFNDLYIYEKDMHHEAILWSKSQSCTKRYTQKYHT